MNFNNYKCKLELLLQNIIIFITEINKEALYRITSYFYKIILIRLIVRL